jgi:ditrans,polycis-polyprenyl diphosphate synthase
MNFELRSWWEWLACKVLQSGPVPEHLAFIMDGNRRFAKQKSIPATEGHTRGFSALKEVDDGFCYKSGIENLFKYWSQASIRLCIQYRKF